MTTDELIAEVRELMELGDELVANKARPSRSYGAARRPPWYPYAALAKRADDNDHPDAHAEVKGEHHGKVAALYARMGDLHAAMRDHYESGAKGAHGRVVRHVEPSGIDVPSSV